MDTKKKVLEAISKTEESIRNARQEIPAQALLSCFRARARAHEGESDEAIAWLAHAQGVFSGATGANVMHENAPNAFHTLLSERNRMEGRD